jgi:hypothetical protein
MTRLADWPLTPVGGTTLAIRPLRNRRRSGAAEESGAAL